MHASRRNSKCKRTARGACGAVCVCERLGKEARVTSAESAMGKSRRGRVKEVMGRPSRPL